MPEYKITTKVRVRAPSLEAARNRYKVLVMANQVMYCIETVNSKEDGKEEKKE